ncbi:MAG: hypothetical protein PHR18_00955 [Oscillospiraceae bacterium]|nr:hypothetical protein [Oscillospiraceae bacterium]
MGKEENRKVDCNKDKAKCNPEIIPGYIYGAYETQAVTDTTHKFEKTNTPKPSDINVEEGREWINWNKK